jgi:hypothetical protein
VKLHQTQVYELTCQFIDPSNTSAAGPVLVLFGGHHEPWVNAIEATPGRKQGKRPGKTLRPSPDHPLQSNTMFHARLFSLNLTAAAAVAAGARAITNKTTTMKD